MILTLIGSKNILIPWRKLGNFIIWRVDGLDFWRMDGFNDFTIDFLSKVWYNGGMGQALCLPWVSDGDLPCSLEFG